MLYKPTVFVVDDDKDMRNSLLWLIESICVPAKAFASAETFLTAYDTNQCGCLLLDVRMPGMGGLHLLDHLKNMGSLLPVIMLTGHGDIRMAVKTLQAGTFDFIEKPPPHQQLLDRIHDALKKDKEVQLKLSRQHVIKERIDSLTPREHQVIDLIIKGDSTKVIAINLELSNRTVEKHRQNIMEKMKARSVLHLIRMILDYKTTHK